MSGTLNSLLEEIKSIFRPIRTRLLYPNVTFGRGVITDMRCVFGENVKVFEKCIISSSHINSYSYIGGYSIIKNTTIGKFCSIASEVRIGLGQHPVNLISTYPGFYSSKASGAVKLHNNSYIQEYLPIKIGNDVWIGNRAIVLDGVEIGDGSIIAANSVVSKDVEPFSIVGGVPAKMIRKRFNDEQIDMLLSFKWWDKDLKFITNNSTLFLDPPKFFEFIQNNDYSKKI